MEQSLKQFFESLFRLPSSVIADTFFTLFLLIGGLLYALVKCIQNLEVDDPDVTLKTWQTFYCSERVTSKDGRTNSVPHDEIVRLIRHKMLNREFSYYRGSQLLEPCYWLNKRGLRAMKKYGQTEVRKVGYFD